MYCRDCGSKARKIAEICACKKIEPRRGAGARAAIRSDDAQAADVGATELTSTFTPGPMVEEIATRWM